MLLMFGKEAIQSLKERYHSLLIKHFWRLIKKSHVIYETSSLKQREMSVIEFPKSL